MFQRLFLITFLIVAPALAFAEDSSEPRIKQANAIQTAAEKMAKGLALTVGGLLAAAKLVKHFSKKDSGLDANRIQILSRKALGPRSEVVLVSVDGVKLLLSSTAEETHLLSELNQFDALPVPAEDKEVAV